LINEASDLLKTGVDISDTDLGKLLTPDSFTSEWAESDFWSALVGKINARQGNTQTSPGGSGGAAPGSVTDENKRDMALTTLDKLASKANNKRNGAGDWKNSDDYKAARQ
jgi:hypothetical protein